MEAFFNAIGFFKATKNQMKTHVLERANEHCEQCGIKHGITIVRGIWSGFNAYQTTDGNIYDASTHALIGSDILGEVDTTGKNPVTKIVLNVVDIAPEKERNNMNRYLALCQSCKSQYTAQKNKSKIQTLFD